MQLELKTVLSVISSVLLALELLTTVYLVEETEFLIHPVIHVPVLRERMMMGLVLTVNLVHIIV